MPIDDFASWGPEPFVARITDVTLVDDVWVYEWKEQRLNVDGTYTDLDNGRFGNVDYCGARETNNVRVSPPANVWMVYRGIAANGQHAFEFTEFNSSLAFVRVDSLSVDGDGNYPSVLCFWNPVTLDWEESASIKLKMIDDETATINGIVLAQYVGLNSSDEPVYVAVAKQEFTIVTISTLEPSPQSFSPITEIEFNVNQGFEVANPNPNFVTVSLKDASFTTKGVVNLDTQTWKGNKGVRSTLPTDDLYTNIKLFANHEEGPTYEGYGVGYLLVDARDQYNNEFGITRIYPGVVVLGNDDTGAYGGIFAVYGGIAIRCGNTGGLTSGSADLLEDPLLNTLYFTLYGTGFDDTAFRIVKGLNTYRGITDTTSNGDNVVGGIITSIGSGPTSIDGGTWS